MIRRTTAPAFLIAAFLIAAFLIAAFLIEAALLCSSGAARAAVRTPTPPVQHRTAPDANFRLNGLTAPTGGLVPSPIFVSGSIFITAPDLPPHSSVTYYLDDQPRVTTTAPPYPFHDTSPHGYSLDSLPPGPHRLRAEATLPGKPHKLHSNVLLLELIPSINHRFSQELTPYANHPEAQSRPLDAVLNDTTTPGAMLSATELATRKSVLAMYLNWGIDLSLDSEHDESQLLLSRNPQQWTPTRRNQTATPLSLHFSADSPFYQPVPTLWPRVLLPPGYIKDVQLNTNQKGDGIGFGQTIAQPGDTQHTIRSQWYSNTATLRTFPFRMPAQWAQSLPWQPTGDHHMIFVDPAADSYVSSYMTSRNPGTGGPDALYATSPTSLGTLGDHGGSIAAHFAELPVMLQPNEATDPTQPIRHALGGPVARTWAARVYPANSWDANVRASTNTCTGKGFTNTGLVPYGGVIQLDPQLDLTELKLTLPARRILEAIQTYGYYVEDFGCTDLDIYTAISETELEPFGGLWGYNRRGIGVQNEVRNVLANHKLYVVAPLVKKQ